MLLLGVEQLACITFVFQVGQLVTSMIPQALLIQDCWKAKI